MKRTRSQSESTQLTKLQFVEGARSNNEDSVELTEDCEKYDDNHNEQIQVSTCAAPRKYESTSKYDKKTGTENPLMKATPVVKTDITEIMNSIKTSAHKLNWESVSYKVNNVHFIKLNEASAEYLEIQNLFNKTNSRYFKITKIERVQNPFLLASFLLKKEAMTRRIGSQKSSKLFHGTKNEWAMDICRDNFDWRFYGQNTGHKFGQGVSFTPISNYATHYGDDDTNRFVMLLANVLVGKKATGTADTYLPPKGCDTTIKPNGEVVVKYEDNEFYPAYKITYKSNLKRRKPNYIDCYYEEDEYYYGDYDEEDEDYDEEDEDYDEEDEYYDEEDEDYDEEDEYYDEEDEDYDEEDEDYDEEDEDYDEEDYDYDEEDYDYDEEDYDYDEEDEGYDEEDEDYDEEDEDYDEEDEDYDEEDEDYDEEDEYYYNDGYYYY